MRSTTLFVWVAVALVVCAWMFPVSDALAQFQFDGTQILCVNDPANNDGIINTIGDSLEIQVTIGGLDLYSDAVEVVFNPVSGLGIIPTLPQTYSCPTGVFSGHRMQTTVVHDSGVVAYNPDSMRIRARYRFRPEGLCDTNPETNYQVWARAVRSSTHDTLCGNSPTFTRAVPCSVCTGCGYIRMDELCGFVDGIIAIGDRVYLDTAAVGALEAALPAPTGGASDCVYVNFNRLTCATVDDMRDTVFVVGDIVDVVECARENGFCGDSFQIRVGYWTGSWPPDEFDSTRRLTMCVRPVDNVAPQLQAGMVDSFRIINGNTIRNDSLVGCCDTLRIFMATDPSYVAAAYPFFGDVDGASYTDYCGTSRVHNFDMSWIGLWFGDLMGESRENDTSGYKYNSVEKGLLCPPDTFLWMSNRFGTTYNPGSANNLMWIDIPFCPDEWDSLQICLLESRLAGGDTLFMWGFDDAGNRSNWIPWSDTALCIDVYPPKPEHLAGDIYYAWDYCVKRFSPYDSVDYNHLYTNLSPDSVEWLLDRVDTLYDASDLDNVFNDVYMIGFDVRVMPQDTGPITRLNYLHPMAPLPMDPTLDTFRWGWVRPFVDVDSLQTAMFTWYGKQGTDSIDPVLGTGETFWRCNLGGGLTVGFTFARWLDAAGCNRVLGSDYDGSTGISDNFSDRNRLISVVDMCPPTTVLPSDTLICTNLSFNSGGFYNLPGPTPKATYLWVGPNGGSNPDPEVRFRPRRIFAEDTSFSVCLVEDTLFYRIRVDTVDLIYALGDWPGVNDSVRWYSFADSVDGRGSPHSLWTPIVFNAGNVNGPEIHFHWGHKYGSGADDYLPDGLYRLMLELRDDAGNVYRDPIYVWLNGWGPNIDSLIVCNTDTVCTFNFYTGDVQDTLAIWLQTDTTAEQVLIDWTCVHNIGAHPDLDTSFAQLVSSSGTFKKWFGYLVITPDMVADVDSLNVYEVAPYEEDCEKGSGGLRIINVRPLDIAGADTIFSEADPDHDCDKAAIGLTPCPRMIISGDYPLFDGLFWWFSTPLLFDEVPPTVELDFGDNFDEFHAISPGKIDSLGGASSYNAVTNWANDQVQDSIFVRLLFDSATIRTDTLDTLILQFVNYNYSPPRIREVRKGLFRPRCIDLDGSPAPQCNDTWHNDLYHGRLGRYADNDALVEFRYFWNGTWFLEAGVDSHMLVPYNQHDTITVKAFVQAVDTIIDLGEGDFDTLYNDCPDTLLALLDIDNINPFFRNNWTGWNNPGHEPMTGTTRTVKNLGWDADGDGNPEDCGFRFSDGEHFRLKVKLNEKVHEFPTQPPYFPNTDGSHHDGSGFWPLTRNWQISPIDLRTGDLFAFGSGTGDSCVVVLDSVVMDSINVDSVYYTLYGYFDFPAAAITYFASNPGPVDSVAMVIRAAWDEAGNPGRYNNPVFNDGQKNDACEDTTFWVTLTNPSPWTGCPLAYGQSQSSMVQGNASIGFVMDYSGSMGSNIVDMQNAALAFVNNMRAGDRGAVIKFNDDVDVIQPFTDDLSLVQTAINSPYPGSQTSLWDAVATSCVLIQPEVLTKALIVLTDGTDNSSTNTLGTATAAALAAGARVYTIGLGGSISEAALQSLASATGGQYYHAPSGAELEDIYLAIAGEIIVSGAPVMGWIAAEEDSVVIKATIIETSEIAICPESGGPADSIHILEGNFQTITDDPNPWVIWNERSAWFLYIEDEDTLGWARQYTWHLRADSSDLATIHCDGDYLPFTLRFNTYGIPWPMFTHIFDNCLQVDVNEPTWEQYVYRDTLGVNLPGCFDPRQPVTFIAQTSDAYGDVASCGYSPGVGVLYDFIWGDFSDVLQDADMDSVVPDSVISGNAYWTFTPAAIFSCVDSAHATIKLHALHDSVNHHDRELYFLDTLWFCSDCVPPHIEAVNVFCECDSALDFAVSPDSCNASLELSLRKLSPGSAANVVLCIADADGDSSVGIDPSSVYADFSWINSSYGWVSADSFVGEGELVKFLFGFDCLPDEDGSIYIVDDVFDNGETIRMAFRFCDNFGNCDTDTVEIAIADTLPPIVDFVYTIGNDSIRAYVTPGDDHVHIYADLTGYAADLVSAPEHVWADMSRFWCDSTDRANHDTVYANYVEQTGPNSYRAYWGWYPGAWLTDPSLYPIPYDSLSLPSDTHQVAAFWDTCHTPSIEGWHDTLWFYVTDASCNAGSAFSVFEVSGIDSTVPAIERVEIYGNGCHEGWVSATPLDNGHIEVWAYMDSIIFNELRDTLLIDSMQANLAQLGPEYAWTQWSSDLKGGAPVYGTLPNDPELVQTMWQMVGNRLVAKWIYLTAYDLGCEDTIVVGVKAMRSTGTPVEHGYYTDVEYGMARVDTTRPVIYDMRVHSSTTSINETTWVSPNVPIYVDVWVYDTNCDTVTDHLGFDLNDILGPAPFITFCNNAGFDTIWTWDTTDYSILHQNLDSLDKGWIVLRWVGIPNFDDTCNAIDLNDITGCIEAHIEDCLSNPAVPVQRSVTTDDVPPQYVMSNSWGDYTIVTGFPGDPDHTGIDSVLVLQRGVYALDYDSLLTVYVIVDNKWNGDAPGDTLISWAGTYINFHPQGKAFPFITANIQNPDEIYYNIDGLHRDSIVWKVPLYNGGGPLFNTNIPSDRYWFQLVLRDTMGNVTGDPLRPDEPGYDPFTLFCDDLDSAISFTIQNSNHPNPGMILLCDSTTVAGSDTDFVDFHNMNLWNNEFFSPDVEMENLYKIYYAPGQWRWYSHEDQNQTRFFIFVEDTVLQSDGIDNDADGDVDEVGEGVDFYTADLRINGWEGPQVGHVDSMNVEGHWINYLWFADNFDQQRYDIYLRISDIYGHIDTLACDDYALSFYEDETCPVGEELFFYGNMANVGVRVNETFMSSVDLPDLNADDHIYVFSSFDSISVFVHDPEFALFGNPHGSGPDLDTTTVDSINYNNGLSSMIELLDAEGFPVVGFVQRYMHDYQVFDNGALMLVDPTGGALADRPDGLYTIRVTLLDRVGNSCVREWPFILDRTCPNINTTLTYTTRPGQNTPTDDLFTSWDYVEIVANVTDALDGVDSIHYEYCFDANRDGNLDAYPYWQTINVLSDEGGAWDTEYPFVVYWNIRNLPWNSEDTLGLPPVNPDTCMNRYFVRVRAEDIYGHECAYVFPVDITDDVAPLAYIRHVDFDFTPQGEVIQCYNPNTGLGDSLIWVSAYDYIDTTHWGYDPMPGDTFTWYNHWFDLAKGVFQYKVFDAPNVQTGDPYTGWTNMWTPGQDTATYRNWFTEAFHIQWNLIHPTLRVPLRSDQYNIRFVGIDVCGNSDPLNTPVITVRVECDTTAPIAVICYPPADSRLTNWRCDPEALNDGWVQIRTASGIWADIDSVAFYFVDSISTPGLGITTFIGGDGAPVVVQDSFNTEAKIYWNTNNLLSGWYWLYAVAYDNDDNFDSDPIWQRVYVDNTPPVIDSCYLYQSSEIVHDGDYFYLYAYPRDPDNGYITSVLFQYLDRRGNWVNLPNSTTLYDQYGLYGADVYADNNPVYGANWDGSYELYVQIRDFDQSPLDSIRFRAIATDYVDIGSPNLQGDRNRDCHIDRDLVCGGDNDGDGVVDLCCMAIEIRDEIPDSTCIFAYNHGNFSTCCLPNIHTQNAIGDGEQFSTCNYQHPLDTLLLVAKVHSGVTDGWLMHFKFWRSYPEENQTTPIYVPNNSTLNPWVQIPEAGGPIVLYHSWDSVYVIWTDARAYLDSADAADGLWLSEWTFAAYTEDLTGNVEGDDDCNTVNVVLACLPNAPITHASYVTNDVQNPENRVRVTEAIPYSDFYPDTIEVIYNRTTGPGVNDPEALVIFYTDASTIRNCRDDLFEPFNIRLYKLSNPGNDAQGRICPTYPLEAFGYPHDSLGWDQYPPDGENTRYAVGLYLDNSYGPGVYNFAMNVRLNEMYMPFENKIFWEGDCDLDDDLDNHDSTRIDLVVRVVNVNEPQLSICFPTYGDQCVSGTVPMSASVLDNPVFTGTIDTVWFQYYDGTAWQPVIDPVYGVSYDTDPGEGYVRFEFDENMVPDMAGWYYSQSGNNVGDPTLSWYAERDLFPDVWLWVEGYSEQPMSRDGNGLWTTNQWITGSTCRDYGFIIDANDNNIVDPDGIDRWVRDPKDPCGMLTDTIQARVVPISQVCMCSYWINFPSRDFENRSYNFRTVVGWHDEVAYHVIENPSLGDTIHVFFVDNEPAEATHDIEFDATVLSGGMFDATPGGAGAVCNPADTVRFVTDVQPLGTHNLVVEDICKVIYQVSLTSQPQTDHSWKNVDTVYSTSTDWGWADAWAAYWVAINPLADNVDNDGDGLVDETHDVQAGNGIGEENVKFWTRSVVYDQCGNTYYSNEDTIWVDVSEPQACITQVGDVAPADNQTVIVPAMADDGSRALLIQAQDLSYADPGVVAIFQYRKLNSGLPWKNIQAASWSDDTVRHEGNLYNAYWDLTEYFAQCTEPDPEGWYQLRAIAIDTVGNSDACDHVICQITIRLNDTEPASRIEVYQIYSETSVDTAVSCMTEYLYITPGAPYCIKAIYAATNIDTGIASLTFQYRSRYVEGDPSEWRNIETIYDHLDHGLNGDTTVCVSFQPRPDEIGEHGFDIRVIVEDYNGNDTSAVVTLYADNTAPVGTSVAAPSIGFDGPCGPRCRLDITEGNAIVTATFLPDVISGEVNVNQVWMSVLRDDGVFSHSFGALTREDDDTWYFNFGGDLCTAWANANLDIGCYYFTVYFNDCVGNQGDMLATTTCGEDQLTTDLICIDCDPTPPELAMIDSMTYYSWDCVTGHSEVAITDRVLDGTTEIGGDQTVSICGHLPTYQQYIREVWLYVESEEAGVTPTVVDHILNWSDSRTSSIDTGYCGYWNLAEENGEGGFRFPSGRYRVWVLAVDAVCEIQSAEPIDEFWVDVDHAEPDAWITRIMNIIPNPSAPDTFEVNSFFGSGAEGGFWVEWADHITPDDSTQAHNQVQLWAKNQLHPNQADAWHNVGYVPSPCNPHWVTWGGDFVCGETYDLVAIVQDRWGNGDLDVERVMDAFAADRTVDIYLHDVTPPATQLWSIGLYDALLCPTHEVVDQQNHDVHLSSNYWDQDVYLMVLASGADENIERVHFQYSLDGTTWFDIATDDQPSAAPPCTSQTMPLPQPWWCDFTGRQIVWSALWDISGLRGHVWVREWAQDICGNTEDYNLYEVMIDVQAPMAKVFAWRSDVNVDNLPCPQWTEPQIPDTLERYTTLTLGACPDSTGTVHYDANKAYWYVKRADASPIDDDVWCSLGRDDDAPFSKTPVQMWLRGDNCLEPQVGAYYDIAVRMSDNNDHTVPWVQFLYNGVGSTPAEQWQDLINRGYVKRVKIVDHIAPVANTIEVDTDCTPDSSVIFLHGNVHLTSMCEDPDVFRVTFAAREQGAEGPWTIIDIVEGDSGTTFRPSGCSWNTELMNGTYIIGAFAEDYYGNRDGNPNVADAWPTHTLIVNVDNERPIAGITSVLYNGEAVTTLERGAVHTFSLNASDNFGLRSVALFFRHSGGDPDNWHLIASDLNWPYSFNWLVPETLVVGWTYDFAAVASDLCNWTDMVDGQDHYVVDGTYPIMDNETYLAITAIGGQDAETIPHVNGTNVCIVAHSEPRLDNVRFLYVSGDDTTIIGTDVDTIGTTIWSLCNWDVTTLPEGPAQICAVGSADLGGSYVTLATDCRNIVIDHSLPYAVVNVLPASYGLLGGSNCTHNLTAWADDIWVQFNMQLTDADIDTVWFEWKYASTDNNPDFVWNPIGIATLDDGLTGRWAYSWAAPQECARITIRARVSDNAVPVSNEALIILADSVRVDNMPPEVAITNINGDVTPDNTEIPWGQVATIVATIADPFCNGANSSIDSAAFFMVSRDEFEGHHGHGGHFPPPMCEEWTYFGSDVTAPFQTMWNTSTVEPGEYRVGVIGWDEAGNCSEYITTVYIVDQLYQRAWIIGYDNDNDPGCDDAIWVVTDDCPPNYTSSVLLQYTTDQGATWISLGEQSDGDQYCDDALDYNMWEFEFEFDSVPSGAIFRAVARDESNNFDPNPPRFQFSDVTSSSEAVIYHEDFVRVHVTGGQVPWVSALLEQAPPNENCFTEKGLVCVNPVEGDPTGYAGILSDETQPCNLDNRDGKITVYTAVPVTRDDVTYMTLVKYEMNIHQVDPQTGSNGWLTSEDQQLQMYIPVDGVEGFGTAWFQPAADFETVNMLPPWQYYYTMLSDVEYVLTENISTGQHESRFKMRFDPASLPADAEDWNVVATYYDRTNDMWTEYGIIYQTRDFENGLIEFYFPCCVNWNASNEVIPADSDTVTVVCPNKLAFAVMFTTVRPIDEWVRFANNYCDTEPDSTYYTPERGPSVGCDVTWWAVLRQGEYTPPENTIDVYLDGIRIINDGVPEASNGYTPYMEGQQQGGTPLFSTYYNSVSGVYSVRFAYEADYLPPWYASGCLRNGQHTIQFYTNNLHTHLTPFWVDRTEPEAWTYPEYINHQVNLWANLTDAQTGVDTNSVYAVISDCTPSAFTIRAVLTIDTIAVRLYDNEAVDSLGMLQDSTIFIMDSIIIGFEVIINEPTRAFLIESEAMTFSPVESGYRAEFSMQWEQLHQWLIANNNAGTMCVTWGFKNNICEWNDSTTYVYTIDVEPPMVIPVSPVGAMIDDDGDGIANEDWRDCLNNDNDWWWDAEFAHWQERIDEDPINFEADTFMFGIRPTIQAIMNDLSMCGSGASGVNVPGIWLNVDGQIFTIADTANANLNFHIMWPYNQTDDAYLQFGGTDNAALDAFYAPGPHRITCAAPDSAGNVGSYQFSWTYYVRSPGPAVVYDTTARPCGTWFNPEETNTFVFDVYATNGAEIAANGAQYSAYYVPSGQRISGPTPLMVSDPLHAHGEFNLSGSFPDGQTGVEIVIEAWNIHFDPTVDSLNGFTRARLTYWADNLPPTFTNHLPEEGEIFNRDEAITIEVFFNDDSPAAVSSAPQTKSVYDAAAKSAEVRVSRTDAAGNITTLSKSTVTLAEKSRNRATLDDNGSGIDETSFGMSIVKPNGDVIVPTGEDFIELDRAHAKYVMVPLHIPGRYTVNVHVGDCVGNVAADAWSFHVSSAAPVIAFTAVEGECQYNGYWNPNNPLPLRVQITEMDGINTKLDSIRVSIVRIFNCATGFCTDTLTPAAFNCSPLPDDAVTNQVFTISNDYSLDLSVDVVELRLIVRAANTLGAAAVQIQPWIVDETAPWITIVSPQPDAVVPETVPVTISANFGDTEDGSVAVLPGGRNGGTATTIKIGPQRVTDSKIMKSSSSTAKSTLGLWASVVTSHLDDLDGNSGVDAECVDLILLHNGVETTNLTEASIIRANNITWIGNLEAGSYTAILSVCDRVCNTASVNWNFVVAPDEAGVTYEPPYYVSSMPHTFIMHTYGENIDHASMNLAIEGAVLDTSGNQLWVPVIEDAAVEWLGDSVWYTANFDLAAYVQLRLTLTMNFAYGIPVPTGSQVYVVDIGAPVIVSVLPDPAEALPVGASPTFTVNFAEVGNTTLDESSIHLTLTTANSATVQGSFAVTLDGSQRTAVATLSVNNLAIGVYILNAEAADVAGNRVTGHWTYAVEVSDHDAPRVVSISPLPTDTLIIGTSPTFVVNLEEVGSSTLDSASIRMRLETINSEPVSGVLTVTLSGNRMTATAALAVEEITGDCRLYLEASDLAGNRLSETWTYVTANVPGPAEINDNETARNYPNPFEAGKVTTFKLPLMDMNNTTGAYVSIKLYDFGGMFVKTVYDGYLMPGAALEWDGRNDDGETVANGVYLARIVTSADGKSKEDIVKVAFKNKK